jgi:hypothetical protein
MQGGRTRQQGGFIDPGLAALLASLVSGSLVGYGYTKETRSAQDIVADSLKSEYGERLRLADEKAKETEALKATQTAVQTELATIKQERDNLKKQLADLKQKVDTASGPALTFQNATSQALQAAIPDVIAVLGQTYPNLVRTDESKAMLTKVLTYPTTTQARLSRLSLPMFYAKQVEPVFRRIVAPPAGGRRRRGGAGDALDAQILQQQEQDRQESERRNQSQNDDLQGAFNEAEPALVNVENAAAETAKTEALAAADAARIAATTPTTTPPAPVTPVAAPTLAQEVASAPVTSGTEQGSAAFYGSTQYPSYEEFAALYAKSLREVALSPASQEALRSQAERSKIDMGITAAKDIAATKAREKRDAAATKAADAIRGKLEKAIQAGETSLGQAVPESQQDAVRDAKRSLSESLDKARELVGTGPSLKTKRFGFFGGAGTLREVTTESEWTELNTPQKAEDVLKELRDATALYDTAVKQAKKAAPAPGPVSVPAQTTSSIHEGILKDTPKAIAGTEKNLKRLGSTIKSIENGLKVIPKPEIFAGGCFVATVAARQTLDILGSAYSRLGGHLAELKDAFNAYKAETKGIPAVLNRSFEYSPSELRALEETRAADKAARDAERAQKAAEQAVRVDDARLKIEVIKKALKQKRRLIYAWDELQAKGIPPPPPPGAVFPGIPPPPPPPPPAAEGDVQTGGAFEILRKLKERIDAAIVGVRKETIPLAGLVFDSEPLIDAIKAIPRQDTLSPAEQEAEAKFCVNLVKAEETVAKQVVPIELGEGVTSYTNPMFGPKLATRPPGQQVAAKAPEGLTPEAAAAAIEATAAESARKAEEQAAADDVAGKTRAAAAEAEARPNIVGTFYDDVTAAAKAAQGIAGPRGKPGPRGFAPGINIGTGVTGVGASRPTRRRTVRKSTLKKRRGGK